jgi:hypothetical protein
VRFKEVAGVAPLGYLAEWRMRLPQKVLHDNPSSAAITHELTGWRPSQPGLLDDIASAAYADAASALMP